MSDSKPVPAALEHLASRLQDISDAWWKEHNPTAPRPTVHFEIPPMSPYADPASPPHTQSGARCEREPHATGNHKVSPRDGLPGAVWSDARSREDGGS